MTAAPPEVEPQAEAPSQPTKRFNAFFAALRRSDNEELDRIQKEMLDSEQDEESRRSTRRALLGLRAQFGDQDSMTELQRESQNDPAVGQMLASVFSKFNEHDKAISVLKTALAADGARTTDVRRSLVTVLLRARRFEEARSFVLEQYSAAHDDAERIQPLELLADVAKEAKDVPMELAALEKWLSLNPLAASARFRLAYLYGDQKGKEKHSAYHYRILAQRSSDGTYRNNLAVAYSAMGLKKREIELLKQAQADNPLAKANLASRYIESGFVDEGIPMAREVEDVDDEGAASRARYVYRRRCVREAGRPREENGKTAWIGCRVIQVRS